MLFNKCTSCGCGNILNKLLWCMPCVKIPIGQNHYVTPSDISTFSNLLSVENSLTCLTKNICNSCSNNNCKCNNCCNKSCNVRGLLPK